MSGFEKIHGGVCAPAGFIAGGVHCGIKSKDKDLALIMSETPATVAGVFTSSKTKAAPVKYCLNVIKTGKKRVIIANSGCANAATGKRGLEAVNAIVKKVADDFNILPEEILIASTGRIGTYLPLDKIKAKIDILKQEISIDGSKDAALAIMTTDTFDKEISVSVPLDNAEIKLGGIAKGAAMINPNMATMLCFLTSDVNITQELLQKALSDSVNQSFNRITVDEDMSTNDTVIILANSRAGNLLIKSETNEDFKQFKKALDFVTQSLALMIVSDGEGATKLIEISVMGALDDKDAERIARAVANSNLFKVAMYGESPNWGRIIAAIGYSRAKEIIEENILIKLNDFDIVRGGILVNEKEDEIKEYMKKRDLEIIIDMGLGKGTSRVWTCDFSHKYIDINI